MLLPLLVLVLAGGALAAAPARAADPGSELRRGLFGLGGWS